jgi:hypothetical protein
MDSIPPCRLGQISLRAICSLLPRTRWAADDRLTLRYAVPLEDVDDRSEDRIMGTSKGQFGVVIMLRGGRGAPTEPEKVVCGHGRLPRSHVVVQYEERPLVMQESEVPAGDVLEPEALGHWSGTVARPIGHDEALVRHDHPIVDRCDSFVWLALRPEERDPVSLQFATASEAGGPRRSPISSRRHEVIFASECLFLVGGGGMPRVLVVSQPAGGMLLPSDQAPLRLPRVFRHFLRDVMPVTEGMVFHPLPSNTCSIR